MINFTDDDIDAFLAKSNYDIRISGNGRWIDQKCSMDVLSIVSDCIIHYTDLDISKVFTVNDIWFSDYSSENVQAIFSKPDPKNEAKNEYDKYFGQPIKLLEYSKILKKVDQDGPGYHYQVVNRELLEFISLRNQNALRFLCRYIEKVLTDSDIFYLFQKFFDLQTPENYKILKDGFSHFTIKYTNIKKTLEPNRIFIKVLNPLAYKRKKLGTYRGHLSKDIITIDLLSYNQKNFRDIYSEKPKGVTRDVYLENYNKKNDNLTSYTIQKAKNFLRQYNNNFRNGVTELTTQKQFLGEKAVHMHHIFPAHLFPNIADFIENLIALTPGQHLSYAHPNGQTSYINRVYQYYCLVSKAANIKNNIDSKDLPTIYSFDNFTYVLDVGLNTTKFEELKYENFSKVLLYLDEFYSDEFIDDTFKKAFSYLYS